MKYVWFIYNGWLGIHYPTDILYNTVEEAFQVGLEYGYKDKEVGVEEVNPWYDDETHELLGWEDKADIIKPTEIVFEEGE